MGRTFELLGLAAFNIFIAIALSAMFLKDNPGLQYDSLSEGNIERFIKTVTDITAGNKPDMDSYAITSFLMDHIAEDSQFVTNLTYDVPGMDNQEDYLEMNKLDFISSILKGHNKVNKHETKVDIEYIKVRDSGDHAQVVTTSYERGMMPVPAFGGGEQIVPVMGITYCDQAIQLSQNKTIQMAGAKCTTSIKVKTGF